MTEEERTDYALFELNKLLKYVVYPEDVACIYMEPVMGEGGYVVPSRKFVQSVREICDNHGILLIFDEILDRRLSGKVHIDVHFFSCCCTLCKCV